MRIPIPAFVVTLLLTSTAHAAVVTYGLDLSIPGEFQIFASASTGDNFGIAGYGFVLTPETSAMVTGFEHLSPAATAASDAAGSIGPAGFTMFRGADIHIRAGELTFSGFQDTINPTPHLIRGLGQSAGSLSGLGLTSIGPAVQDTWGDMLPLARGTYAGDASNFHIDIDNFDTLTNVFQRSEGGAVIPAEIRVTGVNGFNYVPLPPPPPIDPPPLVPPPVDPPPVVPPTVTPVVPPPIAPPPVLPPISTPTRPIVTYNMDLSTPGEFKIFASASTGDNFGLAGYGVALTPATSAMITSYEHVSPAVVAATNSDGAVGSAGFTVLRTEETTSGGGLTFFAGQDTIAPTPHLIRGLGQTAGSFSESGLTPLGPADQPAWGDSMLIAQGTYVGDPNEFLMDTSSFELWGSVFMQAEGASVGSAEVHVVGTNGFSYVPPIVKPPVAVEPPPPVVHPDLPTWDPPVTVDPPPPVVTELPPVVDPPTDDDIVGADPDAGPEETIHVDPTPAPIELIDRGWVDPIYFTHYEHFHISDQTSWVHPDVTYFPEIAIDQFLIPAIFEDGLAIRTFTTTATLAGHVTAYDANISSSLVFLRGQQLAGGDIGVPEPSSALLAYIVLASFASCPWRLRDF